MTKSTAESSINSSTNSSTTSSSTQQYSRHHQTGNSVLGILAILIMVGFFVMCIIRMSPPYFESLTVKSIIETIVDDPDTQNFSTSQIRRRIETEFNTNQIYEVEGKDVEVYRKKGETFIDASYEVRMPLFWRIDAVLKFNDLHYKVGSLEPVGPRQKN